MVHVPLPHSFFPHTPPLVLLLPVKLPLPARKRFAPTSHLHDSLCGSYRSHPSATALTAACSPVHTCHSLTAATCCLLLSATSASLAAFHELNICCVPSVFDNCDSTVLLWCCFIDGGEAPQSTVMLCLLCYYYLKHHSHTLTSSTISEHLFIQRRF